MEMRPISLFHAELEADRSELRSFFLYKFIAFIFRHRASLETHNRRNKLGELCALLWCTLILAIHSPFSSCKRDDVAVKVLNWSSSFDRITCESNTSRCLCFCGSVSQQHVDAWDEVVLEVVEQITETGDPEKGARLVDSLQPDNFTGGAATFTRTGIEVEDMDPLQRIHDNVLGFDIDDESGSVEEIGERSPEVFTGPAAAQGEIINRLPFDPLQRVQENLIMVDVDESGSVKEIGEGNSETFTGLIEALPEIINLLPVEDKVRTVPLVCKAWREALSHPASWRSVDFRSWIRDRWIRHDDRLSEEAQERIIQQVVDRSSGQLREFCTTGGLCTTKSVEYVALKCTLLKCLTITDTSRLHDSSAMELAQRCRQLQTLDLSDCYNISKETLKMFGTYNPSLTKLARNMLRIHVLYDDTFRPPLGDEEAIAIGTYMPRLKILELNTMTTLTDTGCIHIARNCHLLECLDLSGCFNVTADSLREIGMNCPALVKFIRNVHMDFGREYDEKGDAEAGAIAAHMVNLVSLELNVNLTDHGLWEIALGCPKLVSFKPGAKCGITQNLVDDLACQFPRLNILNIKHARRWDSRAPNVQSTAPADRRTLGWLMSGLHPSQSVLSSSSCSKIESYPSSKAALQRRSTARAP